MFGALAAPRASSAKPVRVVARSDVSARPLAQAGVARGGQCGEQPVVHGDDVLPTTADGLRVAIPKPGQALDVDDVPSPDGWWRAVA